METTLVKNFVIDFDSTFTKVEALDILGEIALEHLPEKDQALDKIKEITDRGMDGTMDLQESIASRIEILSADKVHIEELIKRLHKKVSKSFERNRDFFEKHKDHIYIISNGFKDFIDPVVGELGVKSDHVFANTFIYDEDGAIKDFDRSNVLASNGGKVKVIQNLNLEGEVFVIGDGYTDFEIKKAGLANKFYAFTENVSRDTVTENADHITPSLDEFLYVHNLNTALSYPKNRIKVLLLENIHEQAHVNLTEEGYQVETIPGSLSEEALREKIRDVSILGIRSKTQVTERVLENANRLLAIGAYCIGTNQIDLEACTRKGVAVFNAPYSNTRSVVELAIGEIIFLLRNIPDKLLAMHAGKWEKSASGSSEMRGKVLGIVGYGNIGSQLSVLAEAMGMQVQFYDIEERLAIGNAKRLESLPELLQSSDVVSLHVDGRTENEALISDKELALMKPDAVLLNLSRGNIVDITALKRALDENRLKGAAVDVFPVEPPQNNDTFDNALVGTRNTILTPHIGGSTQEAQLNIAHYVPQVVMEFVNSGSTSKSVNFPQVKLPVLENAHRLLHIHHNQPGVLAQIDQVLAEHKINIVGQYLKTNETIGYVITDINKEYSKKVIKDLKRIEGTIRVRVLY